MARSKNNEGISWEQTLTTIINQESFGKKINRDGFSDVYSFSDIIKQHGFTPIRGTPAYLSIDFLSLQSEILMKKGFQIIRTGNGKFIILDSHKFSNCYLNLSITGSSKIDSKIDMNFPHLSKAFEETQEDVALEQPNFLGVYDSIIELLFGKQKWYVGPRGGGRSRFDVYGKNDEELRIMFNFNGQEELDYTIWTKDHILLFEAKSMEYGKGLDIGWHKIAYTASRFNEFKKQKIIPIYLLKWKKTIHLFVFPSFRFYQDGIILNDTELQTPSNIFRIDLV